MTVAEKAEQAVTRRPNSFIPARTLRKVAGQAAPDTSAPAAWGQAMHWATGAVLGALRGVWSVTGIRGPEADFMHTGVRLAFDQTMENATGAGAPPTTWPMQERVVDVGHKLVYSTVTGRVADAVIAPTLVSLRGRTSH